MNQRPRSAYNKQRYVSLRRETGDAADTQEWLVRCTRNRFVLQGDRGAEAWSARPVQRVVRPEEGSRATQHVYRALVKCDQLRTTTALSLSTHERRRQNVQSTEPLLGNAVRIPAELGAICYFQLRQPNSRPDRQKPSNACARAPLPFLMSPKQRFAIYFFSVQYRCKPGRNTAHVFSRGTLLAFGPLAL